MDPEGKWEWFLVLRWEVVLGVSWGVLMEGQRAAGVLSLREGNWEGIGGLGTLRGLLRGRPCGLGLPRGWLRSWSGGFLGLIKKCSRGAWGEWKVVSGWGLQGWGPGGIWRKIGVRGQLGEPGGLGVWCWGIMRGCSSGGLESTEGCLGVWGHLGGSHKAVERMFGAYLRGGLGAVGHWGLPMASGGRFETSGLGASEGLLVRVPRSKGRGVGQLGGPKVFEGSLGTFRDSFYGILKWGDETWGTT